MTGFVCPNTYGLLFKVTGDKMYLYRHGQCYVLWCLNLESMRIII